MPTIPHIHELPPGAFEFRQGSSFFFELPAETDEKPYFKVAYKSSGEVDRVRLTLITSAARLAASLLASGYYAVN